MITPFDLSLLARAASAALLGAIIGWERERHGSPAGDRTLALVSLGSAVFAALSLEFFPGTPDRVVAAVVTEVGFLGTGVIIRPSSGPVRGLTTAATVWSIAALGTVIGLGRFALGLGLAGLILLILLWEHTAVASRLGMSNPQHRVDAGSDPCQGRPE